MKTPAPVDMWLGKVTQVSPLEVERNGRPGPQPAAALDDFTGATTATEVLGVTIAGRRLVWRIR